MHSSDKDSPSYNNNQREHPNHHHPTRQQSYDNHAYHRPPPLEPTPRRATGTPPPPGLVNNLLSIAALVDACCKVFFHCTRCKITFDRAIILQEWRDPKNRLWRVKIVDNGRMTNYKEAIPPQDKPTTTHPPCMPTTSMSAPPRTSSRTSIMCA
jgi:hypothetical protein